MNYGMTEGRTGSGFLDVNFYKRKYGDLSQVYGNNNKAYYEHFVKYGMAEGRQGSASFDVRYYLNHNEDIKKAYGNNYTEALKHYAYYGKNEGRQVVANSSNSGNDNNIPISPSTDYTPVPDQYGRKIIPQKELAKCITKVPITTQNWQDYFEVKDHDDVSKNAFGEITRTVKNTGLFVTKDNTYYSTALEFEVTNPNLLYGWAYNSDSNSGRKKEVDIKFAKGFGNDDRVGIIRANGQINQSTETAIDDYRVTINDFKVNRTTGNVYIFNIPDSFWTVRSGGTGRDIYVEYPENKDGSGYENYYKGIYATEGSWIYCLGQDIENGILKDINL